MAKSKSKKAGKAADSETVVSSETPKKASVPRGVRKHLRELEGQLTDAARKEQKRLQKLERARQRRESIDSALDKLRGQSTVATPPAQPPKTRQPSSSPAAGPAHAARRPAATRRPATGGTRTARKALPAATPASKTTPADSEKSTD